MKGRVMLLAALFVVPVLAKTPASPKDVFYVYREVLAKENHYIPSGWMGDYGDLKIDVGSKDDPADGLTAIKWTYDAQAKQGANWAGVYWQHPANNWGEKPGGYDLKGYKRLTFWVRGKDGGEVINEFKVGGITGEHGDSDAASIGPITLEKKWVKHTIDLAGKDLTKIIGGFCWATSKDNNPNGFVMYLDEIRYEK